MLHDNSTMHRKILCRPRVQALIKEGLQHPLLVMLAGPGYGKTQEMTSYISKCNANILWIRLGNLDNLHTHFWNHLTQALSSEYPDFSKDLQELPFPDTPSNFNVFANLLAKNTSEEKQTIWIFDDFGEITDQQIKIFFRMIVDAEIQDFSLVLISNVLNSTESVTFMKNNQFLISGESLKFTKEEIQELYSLYNISLKKDELDDIEDYTNGWPLPLHLLVLQHNTTTNLISQSKRLTNHIIFHIFEERFFSSYSIEYKKLIVKLSLLNSFTKEFVVNLYEGLEIDIEMFNNHIFLICESTTNQFYFHQLYHMFLRQKQYLLKHEEEQQLWKKAADYYASTGNTMEAITYYRKCNDNIGMLKVICDYIGLEKDITVENAPYFLEHLNLLTPEEVQAHPISEHMRALIHLNLLEFEKAETILMNLRDKLLPYTTKEAFSLLGEVYAATGSIHMLKNQEDFGEFYKKALHYLPEGSNYHNTNQLSTRNNHCFSLPDNMEGAKERMEKAVHNGMPWVNRFLRGSMSGKEHVFSAEASYLSFEMNEAKQHSYKAILKAKANAQHDLVCNCYIILARIGFIEGNFEEMSQQIENVVEYAKTCDISIINEIRDTALGWYYVKLHDDKRIPKSIYKMNNESKPMWTYGRSQLIYANYLIRIGEYARIIGMLEYPKGLHLIQGIFPDRIVLYIMLASGYYHLGDLDAAMKALWTAYDMSYNNGLITLFIEADNHMIKLIEQARKQDTYKFDNKWLDLIYNETMDFSKRAKAVRAAYQKQNPGIDIKNNPLSKREREVLQALSQGLSREEISHKQYISVNTVKSTIRNIYNKLNTNNRAEAVSIAIMGGYIEGYKAK